MSGMADRISGRIKKAAGDLTGDENMHAAGEREERKAEAKAELADAQRRADEKAEEIARLERQSAGGHGHRADGDDQATAGHHSSDDRRTLGDRAAGGDPQRGAPSQT